MHAVYYISQTFGWLLYLPLVFVVVFIISTIVIPSCICLLAFWRESPKTNVFHIKQMVLLLTYFGYKEDVIFKIAQWYNGEQKESQ
jgi:hypothetical protein